MKSVSEKVGLTEDSVPVRYPEQLMFDAPKLPVRCFQLSGMIASCSTHGGPVEWWPALPSLLHSTSNRARLRTTGGPDHRVSSLPHRWWPPGSSRDFPNVDRQDFARAAVSISGPRVDREGSWQEGAAVMIGMLPTRLRPLLAAGTLMGIGLGGFIDGIVFHQILQLHSMLSNWLPRTTVANVEINMFWDGLFHALCYLAVVVALFWLWRLFNRQQRPLSGQAYFGSLWWGWGLFNLVEGAIDHELLQVHHVYQADPDHFLQWDVLFLLSGIIFLSVGWLFIKPKAARV